MAEKRLLVLHAVVGVAGVVSTYCCLCYVSVVFLCNAEGVFDFLSLRNEKDSPWRELLDYERLLCYCCGKLLQEACTICMVVSKAVSMRGGPFQHFVFCILLRRICRTSWTTLHRMVGGKGSLARHKAPPSCLRTYSATEQWVVMQPSPMVCVCVCVCIL